MGAIKDLEWEKYDHLAELVLPLLWWMGGGGLTNIHRLSEHMFERKALGLLEPQVNSQQVNHLFRSASWFRNPI